MPNHFHLVMIPFEKGSVSRIVNSLTGFAPRRRSNQRPRFLRIGMETANPMSGKRRMVEVKHQLRCLCARPLHNYRNTEF